ASLTSLPDELDVDVANERFEGSRATIDCATSRADRLERTRLRWSRNSPSCIRLAMLIKGNNCQSFHLDSRKPLRSPVFPGRDSNKNERLPGKTRGDFSGNQKVELRQNNERARIRLGKRASATRRNLAGRNVVGKIEPLNNDSQFIWQRE